MGVIHGIGLASCGTMAILSLSLRASLTTSIPFIVAVPEVGSSSVAKIRTSVVLPEPFLPINTKMPWEGRAKLTESKAFDLLLP
jgi:hypothetical protein